MFVFVRAGPIVARSFRKLLDGLTPSLWPRGQKVLSYGTDSDDSKRCEMYDDRKYGHKLPKFDTALCFDPLRNIPSGVFRTVAGEPRLGPCAAKCYYCYQNPEYFSFHHMTYYDFHLVLRQFRNPSPKSGRKP